MADNSLGSLSIGLGLDTHELVSGFAMVRERINGFAGLVAGAAVGIGASFAGLGIQATKMAGDFQESMTSLVTGAGESQKNLGMVSQGILTMAPQVGTATKDLSAGMYMIESSGQHGAQALSTLKDVAEGAKVGMASLADVANGVTTEMTDYAAMHVTAAQATNELITAVSLGKTHLQDLATAESDVLPAAAAMHIGLTDVNAALATMTGEGTDASSAATYLRQLLTALESPAKKGATALADIGLSTKQVADEMKVSLPGTLQLITDHLKTKFPEGSAAYVAALKDIAGGSKQMQGILELTGSHLSTFKDNVSGITDAVKKGGDSITGWNKVQDDFNFKLDQAKEMVESLGIKIGTALLPVAGQLFDKISPLIQGFSDWIDKSGALSHVTSGLSSDLQDIGTFLGNDVIPSVTGLAQSVEPIITDFMNWNDKTGFLKNTLSDAGQLMKEVATDVGTNLVPPIRSLIGNLEQWLSNSNAVHDAMQGLGTVIGETTQILGGLISGISTLVGWFSQSTPAANLLKDAIVGVGAAFAAIKMADFAIGVGNAISSASQNISSFGELANRVLGGITEKVAPNLSRSIEGVGTSAQTAQAKTAIASAEMETELDGVGTNAEINAGKVSVIGAAAQDAEGEVAASSAGMKTSLGSVMGMLGLVAAAGTTTFGMVKGNDPLADIKKGDVGGLIGYLAGVTTGAGQLASGLDSLQQGWAKFTGTADEATKKTKADVLNNLTGIKTDGLSIMQQFETQTVGILSKLGADGTNIMKTLDTNTQQYWNDIANYVSNQSALAEQAANRHLGGIRIPKSIAMAENNFAGGSSGVPGYASGITNFGGGLAVVGERGPELVDLPRGSSVFPNGTMPAMASSGGAKQPVHIHIEVGGREMYEQYIDDIGDMVVQRMRLIAGTRV